MTRFAVLLVLLALTESGCGCAGLEAGSPETVSPPSAAHVGPPIAGAADTPTAVQTEMRNVDFHLDSDITFHITRQRGQLLRTRPFDLSPDRSNEQPAAGYSRSTAARPLVVHMADLGTLRPGNGSPQPRGAAQ